MKIYFGRAVGRFSDLLVNISSLLLLLLTLLVTLDVVMRYFFNSPMLFAAETSEFMMAALIFFGFADTFRKKGHVRVELVTQKLPRTLSEYLRKITLSLGVLFFTVFNWQIVSFIHESFVYNKKSAVMLFPIWIPQLVMLIGSLALWGTIVVKLIRSFSKE